MVAGVKNRAAVKKTRLLKKEQQEQREVEEQPVIIQPTRHDVRQSRIEKKRNRKALRREVKTGTLQNLKSRVTAAVDQSGDNNNNNNNNEQQEQGGGNSKQSPYTTSFLLAASSKKKKKINRVAGQGALVTSSSGAGSKLLRSQTSANLSDRQREKLIVSEIQHVQKIQNHASFKQDPLGALQQHLSATASMLKAPNATMSRNTPQLTQQQPSRKNKQQQQQQQQRRR